MADTVARLSGVVEARRLIEAAPLAALDRLSPVVVWEDGSHGSSTTRSPAAVVRRYGLDADLAGALESVDIWNGAVTNR